MTAVDTAYRAQIILAHGAGAGSNSDFMKQICNKITEVSQNKIKVILFDFPYMQLIQQTGKKRPPNKMPVLSQSFIEQMNRVDANLPLFIGGKSMGARVALQACLDAKMPVNLLGYIALGYPFHPVGKPEKLRLALLNSVDLPGLIVQGERDTFGKRAEVDTYQINDNYQFNWIATGDHSLKPLKASGFTQLQMIETAANSIKEFVDAKLI
ncbi:alpha/beta family hydrolase [Catenovulum adriaticum]|uniref:KANL3/Tex30 alpha/beta hydrolase-like domain-containing protein n=1 Tax=Catenovulum adriaticum TaxID=2984846 RepID=A0ABY7APH2_9ALTE|nr:alpha/beta family hydrolase [Catenovulum sp. TS8]WAJ71465.1 hypothetical protein OLW01_06620 [Catenovulum sp. TS8]